MRSSRFLWRYLLPSLSHASNGSLAYIRHEPNDATASCATPMDLTMIMPLCNGAGRGSLMRSRDAAIQPIFGLSTRAERFVKVLVLGVSGTESRGPDTQCRRREVAERDVLGP
jgi:hypothetical protein